MVKQINLIDLINEINKKYWADDKHADNDIDLNLSELHMHKSLFILYGMFYKEFKKELFKPNFEAWKYGPVEIDYRMFCKTNDESKKNKFDINFKLTKKEEIRLHELIKRLIRTSPRYLVEFTHENYLWDKLYYDDKLKNKFMNPKEIQESFKDINF